MATNPTAAPAQPAARSHTALILLAVVVLLLAVGLYGALRMTATKAEMPAARAQNTTPSNDGKAKAAGAPQGARADARTPGTALGASAKPELDPPKAPDTPAPAGQQIEPPDTSSSSATGTPDAANAGQATGAMAGLLGALSSAVGGAHPHDPVDFHTLETLLPTSLPGLPDATPDGNADDTMSIKTTSAHVDFSGANGASVHLSIRDATAISGLAGLADMPNPDSSEQGDSYERTETLGGRSVHEKWDATRRHGELSLSVGERFAVDVAGDNVDMDALKNALARMDLAKLESMKDANPKTK